MSTDEAILKLNLLGSAWIGLNGAAVSSIESDKARALLIYLVVESDRAHSRQALATLLWPDTEERVALQNLRQALFSVRQALGDQTASRPYLLPTRQTIQFDASRPHEVDVLAFSDYLEAVQRHAHSRITSCAACIALLQRAAELYQGDFLTGFSLRDCDAFEDWLQGLRETLRSRALDVLAHLATYHNYRRDYELAEGYYRRQVELAPWHEEAHRGIMCMLALRGQTAAAIHHYTVLQAAVMAEYGAEPMPESQELLARIRAGQLQPEAEATANPYKGLQAFTEHDAEYFFGREAVTQQLLTLLLQHGCCTVIGASGSGKSSVIHAGLLPMLFAGGAPRGGDESQLARGGVDWVAVSLRPGDAPFASLSSAFTRYLPPGAASDTLVDRLRNGELSLFDLAAMTSERQPAPRKRPRPPLRILVVVDQFEELFSLCTDAAERQAFIDLLLAPCSGPPAPAASPFPPGSLRVLISLRADFTDQAISYRPLADAIQQNGLLLGPLNSDELRRAIVEPARQQGVTFEPGLVERLLKDVANEPGNLLLLQFALMRLWERRKNSTLTHFDYEETGGVTGALAHYADGVLKNMDAADQAGARRLFLRMVQPGQDAPDTRRMVTRATLGDEDWRLVQRLADARLLVTDQREGQEVAEVAHEALIRSWGQLRSWLETDRQYQTWHFQLQAAHERWLESGRDANLLLRGAQLAQAETWMGERGEDLSANERTFITAAIDERDRRHREQEAQRQRELAQAQALASAEHKRAETEARTTARLRLLAGFLAVSLLAVLIATYVAWSQARVARLQSERASVAQEVAEAAQERAEIQAQEAQEQRQRAEKEAEAAEMERKRAEEQTQIAQSEHKRAEAAAQRALSRQLSAQATALISDHPDLGLLLAMESASIATPDDKTDLLVNMDISPLMTRLLHGETAPVHQAEFRAPNTIISSADGSVRSWALNTGQSISQTIALPPDKAAAISPDGRRAATFEGNSLTLWDPFLGQAIAPPFTDHPGEIDFLVFSVDGSRLISGSRDGTMILRDAGTGEVLKQLSYDGSGGMALGPGGDMLAMFDTFDGQTGLELWDLRTGEQIAGPVFGHKADVQSLNYSNDGSLLVTASADKTLRLWDGKTLAPVGDPLVGHSARVLTAAFSPDNTVLASGGADKQIILWDVASGQPIGQPIRGHSNWVRDLSFSRDGRTLVSTDAGGGVILWDLSTHQTLHGHEGIVRGVAVTPDNKTLITASYDRTIKWWNALSGEVMQTITTPHQTSIITMAISQDGATAATGDVQGIVSLWDVKSASLLFPAIQGNPAVIVSLAFSPDGRTVAAGDFDGKITFFDVESGQRIGEPFQAHEGWVLSLAFSPDGKLLASGATNAEIKLWEVRAGQSTGALQPAGQPLEGHTNWVTSLLFWPDGKRLISGSGDHTIRQWDVDTQQPIGEALSGHTAHIWGLQVYPPPDAGGDPALVSMDSGGTILFWDLAQGAPLSPPLHTFTESEAQVISPDGQRLYQGAFNNLVEMWKLPPLAWEARACAIANRNLSREEWDRFMPDLPYRETCERQ